MVICAAKWAKDACGNRTMKVRWPGEPKSVQQQNANMKSLHWYSVLDHRSMRGQIGFQSHSFAYPEQPSRRACPPRPMPACSAPVAAR
jgi:hypothetical protein